MAIQKSSIKLEGSVGDLVFYKQNDTYQVKQRSGHSAKRIATDPNFVRTRENSSEFGHASHIAKCIRIALKQALQELHPLFYETSLANRLTQRITSIVKSDSQHARGLRRVQSPNLRMLTNFSINSKAALKDTFFIPIEVDYNGQQEVLHIKIPALYPEASFTLPEKATLLRFHLIAISLDIDAEASSSNCLHTQMLSTAKPIDEHTLSLDIPVSDTPTFICFGVSFYREFAGYPIPIDDPNQNALDIIRVYEKMN